MYDTAVASFQLPTKIFIWTKMYLLSVLTDCVLLNPKKSEFNYITLGWYKLHVFVFEVSLTIGQLLPTFFPNQSTTVEKRQDGGGLIYWQENST